MNQDDNKPGPPPGDDRTVFMPFADFKPLGARGPGAVEETALPTAGGGSQPPRESTGASQFAPRADGQGIQVGDVLNHIFEVRRFIARGGMGEVFEGVNVNTDERVAIKVMLPSLAADANVISMFRKEARTLTRLQHEALVQYRVLAQEPQLGVLYIVTEYVHGTNLADVLGRLEFTTEDLAQLLRRLAAGLRVAHALGAIHRDMSPDNVLLEDGRLSGAKIIDFGIAKDLDPGSATIVGDGFAGKLNYVAPEQLGDFGREVGPWSDVYSLALVILAVAGRRNVQMGGTLVDAVDKRRAGPDLTAAPEELRPVLEMMTRANPADRLRSMDEVLAELDKTGLTGRLASLPPTTPPGGASGPGRGLLIGGVVAALLVAVLVGWLIFGRGGEEVQAAKEAGETETANPVEVARGAVNSVLPSVACTWLDIVDIARRGDAITVALTGVAGNPSAAQSEISRALAGAGVNGASINFEEVSTITQSGCGALDTYRQIRAPDGQRLAVPQRKFEKRTQQAGDYAGRLAANAMINLNVGDPAADFALVGIEPSGVITPMLNSRQGFDSFRQGNSLVTDLGGDRYRVQIDADHDGWSGILMLTGKGPFPSVLIAPGLVSRGPDWTNRFVSAAAAGGWQSNMVWFKNVDEVPD